MRFYKNEENRSEVEEFIGTLPSADAQRVVWMLSLIEESDWLPDQYAFNHRKDERLMEFRISSGDINYWLLAIKQKDTYVLVKAGSSDRFQKAPDKEVKKVLKNIEGYSTGFRILPVSDLKKYISLRKQNDPEFKEGFEGGFLKFRLGSVLRQVREKAGITQKEAAKKVKLSASAISKIENHSDELKLSDLEDYLEKLQSKLQE